MWRSSVVSSSALLELSPDIVHALGEELPARVFSNRDVDTTVETLVRFPHYAGADLVPAIVNRRPARKDARP
jgi:hypothetical protein